MENDDALLVSEAKNGSSAAFSKLCEKYTLDLYRFALYMVGSPEDAEDSVQDALLSAWKNIGSLNNNDVFKSWLFKILKNRCTTNLCKRFKSPDNLPIEDYCFLVGNNPQNSEIGVALKKALSELTPPDGQIILLSIIGGFKSNEIAKIYGMPPATVRSRQKRALEKLRKELS